VADLPVLARDDNILAILADAIVGLFGAVNVCTVLGLQM
jgi:cobalamin synthase